MKLLFLLFFILVNDLALSQEDFETKDYGVIFETGLVVPDNWRHGAQQIEPRMKLGLPESFDWREKAPNKKLTPIRNQGSCGSCWAFSTAATVADAIHIKDNRPDLDLSEQWLVSCNSNNYGCNGGWYVFDMYQKKGSVYEVDYPYTGTDSSCKGGLHYNEKLESYAFVDTDSNVPSVEKIKAAIYNYGAISVAVNADGNMQSYSSGIFSKCSSGENVNHAVNLVGWNDKGGYWIMRNSWGESWGENGYMKIKYGCNAIGYAASFVTYGSSCEPQPLSFAGRDRTIRRGEKTKIGMNPKQETTYSWLPDVSIESPSLSSTMVKPQTTTVYTLIAQTKCGTAKNSVTVEVVE